MLPPVKEDLLRRRWIWQALSDLFLDEEVTEDTLRWIARICAECGYSEDELDSIYREEVAPAVAFNLLDMAGTWGYFDTVWLEKRILRPRRLGYWFDRLIIFRVPLWLLRHDWKRIKSIVGEEYKRVQEERLKQGGLWKPCCAEEAPCYRWEFATLDVPADQPRE